LTETQIGRHLHTPEVIERVRQLKPIADELGVTRGTLALAWVLRKPSISSAIVGATSPEQMTQNLAAADFRLPQEALEQIETIFAVIK
jgi:aryl-alcohol dehydrogenase-like predicted oxidoreductase